MQANAASIRVKRGALKNGDETLHAIMDHLEGEEERLNNWATSVETKQGLDETTRAEINTQIAEMKANVEKLQGWSRALDAKLPSGDKFWHNIDGSKPGRDEVREEIGLFVKELANYRMNKTDGKPRYGSKSWERSQTEGVQGDGGFLVLPQQSNVIAALMYGYGLARRITTVLPMTKNKLNLPVGNADPTVSWPGELVAPTPTKATVLLPVLEAKKAVATDQFSIESIDDTEPSLLQYVADRMLMAFAREEDRIVFAAKGSDGGGSDPFDGLLYRTGVQELVMASSNTSFNNLTYENLCDIQDKVSDFIIDDAAVQYIYSNSVQIVIRKLKDSNGRPLLLFDGMAEMTQKTLMGYGVSRSPIMPKIADDAVSTPFILFGEFNGTALGVRNDFRMDMSEHVLFAEGGMLMRCMERFGTQLLLGTKIGRIKTAAS